MSPAAVPGEPKVSRKHHGIPGAQVSDKMSARVEDHTPLLMRLVLISVSGIAIFYSLGERLLKWDEAIYAEVAREMLNRHSWLAMSRSQQLAVTSARAAASGRISGNGRRQSCCQRSIYEGVP